MQTTDKLFKCLVAGAISKRLDSRVQIKTVKMAARAPRQTLMQLWKRGWNEIPEVMGSSAFALVAYIGCPIILYNWWKQDKGNHRYKPYYIVYRPEDPRVKRIRKFPDSPPATSVGC